MEKGLLSKTSFLLLLCLVILLNATGLFNDILEPDGTLYACLAKQIANSGNWLFLSVGGNDWLDKPHLPFWLAAISFKIYGISAFAYKLPSFIFFIVTIIYCYKLSAAFYTKATAQLATLIYATAIHTIISNFDGKVEIYLGAFILGAIYHIYKAFENKWFWHIVAAALLSACAVMTKGIFSLIPIAGGFIIFWFKTKQWHQFLNAKWYLLVLLVFIFILPELYSLYYQFDLHPEKVVFGKTRVSGLRFFFWDSQFGRFLNNGPIKGTGNPSFFLHTTLWAFLPWSLILLLALVNSFTRKTILPVNAYRWIIGGGASITFLLFSFSKFQLPHYIVIIFPQLAMVTASYLVESVSEKTLKKINLFQTFLFVLLIALIAWIMVLYTFGHITWFLIVLSIITIIFFYKGRSSIWVVIKKNTCFALLLAIFLNCLFYPSLLQYQSGMMAGKWLNGKGITQKAAQYKYLSYSFDFYYKGKVFYPDGKLPLTNYMLAGDSLLLFSSLSNLRNIKQDTVSLTILKSFPQFGVSQLNIHFLDHQTRSNELDTFAIAILKRKSN